MKTYRVTIYGSYDGNTATLTARGVAGITTTAIDGSSALVNENGTVIAAHPMGEILEIWIFPE